MPPPPTEVINSRVALLIIMVPYESPKETAAAAPVEPPAQPAPPETNPGPSGTDTHAAARDWKLTAVARVARCNLLFSRAGAEGKTSL